MASSWLVCEQCQTRFQVDDAEGRERPRRCGACASRDGSAGTTDGPRWYHARGREKLGPVDLARLRALVAAGQLQPTDMLLQVGASRWVQAGTLGQLFPAGSSPSVRTVTFASGPPAPAAHAPEGGSTESLSGLPETVDAPGPAAMPTTDVQLSASPAAAAASPNVPGYRVLEVLGRGGMGVVYRAEHLALKRPVALKMILARGHAGEQELQRFLVEAEAVARLQHPNIVQIFEVGEHEGWPFLALELIGGGSLSAQVQGTPWPPRRAAALVEQLARAMQHAHETGIVHRDLKPANVLLGTDGTPKISDFGLAKKLDDASGLTQTGAVMGTPSYMAPEQAEGRVRDMGPAADVYALGAILYELLTGRPPFKAAGVLETLDLVRTREPVAPRLLSPNVPRDLETVCLKCLEKGPARRYPGAGALADDLRRWQAGEPITARPVGPAERALKWTRRNPVVAGLLGAVLVSLALGAAVATFFAIQAGNNAAREKVQAEEARRESERADAETRRANENSIDAARQAARALELARQEKAARVQAEHQTLRAENARHALQLDHAFRAWRQYDLREMDRILREVDPRLQQAWETRFVRQLAPRAARPLLGHTDVVTSVAVSRDGRRVVSGGTDRTLRLWDAATGQVLRSFNGHAGEVTSLALGREDRLVVSGGQDGTVKVWDVETGRTLRTLPGHTGPVTGVAFSHDGRLVASGGRDGTVRIRDAGTGRELHACTGHARSVASLAFSDDDSLLASSGFDNTVRVWDVSTGRERRVFTRRDPASVAFSRDGRQLLSLGRSERREEGVVHLERHLLVADVTGGEEKQAFPVDFVATALARSADGKRLVLGSHDPENVVTIWELGAGRQTHTLRGHGQRITGLALSADGRRLVSGSADKTVQVWDLGVRPETASFTTLPRHARGLAVSADGRRVLTGNHDRTLTLWDAADGRELRTFHGHTGEASAVALSGDGRRAFSGSGDRTIKVWDAQSGAEARTLQGHTGRVACLALSRDGRRLVSSSDDHTVRVWDAESGREEHTLTGHDQVVRALALSRDGRWAVSADHGRTLKVWDADTGHLVRDIEVDQNFVHSLAITSDGRRVIAPGGQNAIRVWDVASGREALTLRGHAKRVTHVALLDDGRLVSGAQDGTVRVWDLVTGEEKLTLALGPQGAADLAVSEDGSCIVAQGFDHVIRVWKAEPEPERFFLRDTSMIQSVALTGDGRRIVSSGGPEKTVKVWDAGTGRLLHALHGHTLAVQAVALSADGQRIVSGGHDRTIKIWDAAAGKEVRTLTGHEGSVQALACSRDGRRIVSLDQGKGSEPVVRVWDADRGQQTLSLTGKGTIIVSLALSADGRYLATAGRDRVIRIRDADSGREIQTCTGHTGDISSLAFRGDGRAVASGGGDRTVKVWDVATGKETFSLLGHQDVVHAVAFSRDGRRIASGGVDRAVKVWDARTGQEIRTLRAPGHPVLSLAISDDGQLVVSGGWDSTIRVWELGPGG